MLTELDGRWLCHTKGCGFETYDEDFAVQHSERCGVNPDKKMSQGAIENMLAEYRDQVRAELVLEIANKMEELSDEFLRLFNGSADPGNRTKFITVRHALYDMAEHLRAEGELPNGIALV